MPPISPERRALELPDGRQIERMPLGFAAGHWWLAFVIFGPGNWLRGTFGNEELVRLNVPVGTWAEPTISVGGGDNSRYLSGDVLHVTFEFDQMPWIEIEYVHDGATVDTERLVLPEAPA